MITKNAFYTNIFVLIYFYFCVFLVAAPLRQLANCSAALLGGKPTGVFSLAATSAGFEMINLLVFSIFACIRS